jgi:hypothetical protein
MSAFHGNFFVRSTDLLSLAAVPMDQSYAIEIQIEETINAPFVVFQTAILHTTCFGERRIRVLTLALPTTSSISELYGSVDTIALATLLANKAVERSMQSKLEDARDAILNKLVDILGTYKATMTSSGSGASPQLVISNNMKFLPLLLLGLLKHVRSAVIQASFTFTDYFLSRVGWITPKFYDTFRSSSVRSSTSYHPSIPTASTVSASNLLFSARYAKRSERSFVTAFLSRI